MINRLEFIEKKYEELNSELLKPEIINDYIKLNKLNQEKTNLEDIVIKYREFKKIKTEIEELKLLINDSEMAEIAKKEIEILELNLGNITKDLEILLVPKDENDGKNIIMEIRGAAGGDEANIFAGDLFRMYSKYADLNNWKIEINNALEGSSGGFTQIEFLIKGNNVYSKLKFENGAHRVQRVPETETQGRIHTSTATVAVMPEVEDVELDIKQEDIRVDVYRSSGKGGQGVNTTDSAVRLTHIPSGIVVTCQNERSQIKNKDRAMKVLKAKLYDLALREKENASDTDRKNKIGTGDRSEKIRTYNYPNNRVTDHRINLSIMELDRIMNGSLEPIIEALITEDLKRKMANQNEK
ncbi:MAG: peptide chain release factor 1 [Bacilli bacterium]|nr:peptide chain release factor 1 [Bacilli bacterium]MDD3896111.1 peptide chain release factor 1 [Bacilli bacterium]MDD4407461.1 peptide chain release factor 1 [Bacilli bacterium]